MGWPGAGKELHGLKIKFTQLLLQVQLMCFTHHTVTALDAAIVGVSWFIGSHSSLTVTHCHGFNASPVHDYTHPSSTGANHREWWVHGRDGRDDSNASVKVDHIFCEVSLCVFDQTLRIVQLPLEWTDGALNLKHKASYIFCPLGDNYMRQRSRKSNFGLRKKKLRIINVISKNNQGLVPTYILIILRKIQHGWPGFFQKLLAQPRIYCLW